jgi:hypothetical protein
LLSFVKKIETMKDIFSRFSVFGFSGSRRGVSLSVLAEAAAAVPFQLSVISYQLSVASS